MMLSQSSGAIRSRRWRERHRVEATGRRAGRPVNLKQHEALIAAVERVMARRHGNLHVLACDLGFAHQGSMMGSYRRAKVVLVTARRRVAEVEGQMP